MPRLTVNKTTSIKHYTRRKIVVNVVDARWRVGLAFVVVVQLGRKLRTVSLQLVQQVVEQKSAESFNK